MEEDCISHQERGQSSEVLTSAALKSQRKGRRHKKSTLREIEDDQEQSTAMKKLYYVNLASLHNNNFKKGTEFSNMT